MRWKNVCVGEADLGLLIVKTSELMVTLRQSRFCRVLRGKQMYGVQHNYFMVEVPPMQRKGRGGELEGPHYAKLESCATRVLMLPWQGGRKRREVK